MDTTYYTVHDWMKAHTAALTHRNVFALVWSYTVAGKEYFATKSTTAEYLGLSERTVATAFSDLVKGGQLVCREERTEAGNRRVFYAVAPEILKMHMAEWPHNLITLYSKYACNPREQLQKMQEGFSKNCAGQLHNMPRYNNNDIEALPIINSESCEARGTRSCEVVSLSCVEDDEPALLDQQTVVSSFTEGEVLTPEVMESVAPATNKHGQSAAGGKIEKSSAQGAAQTPSRFDSWLTSRGVSPDNASTWAKVRADGHCKNTPEALKAFDSVFVELAKEGITADQAVAAAVAVADPAGSPKKQWKSLTVEYVRHFYQKAARPAYAHKIISSQEFINRYERTC